MKFYAPFLLLLSVGVCAQTTSENYVKKTTYNVRTHNGIDGVSGATLVKIKEEDKRHTITYFDGLGRPKQSVAVGVTPSGKDLVTHVGYDDFGRQHRDYLPVPASGTKGSFRDDAEAQTLSYYNKPEFDNTQNPYTERIYEASPLNRVLEVGAPGNRWKANPKSIVDNTIKTDHGANGWDDLVRWFEVDFKGGNTQQPVLKDKGVYPAGQLYKTTTKDENWKPYRKGSNKTEIYTNKQGQVVLKRAFSNHSWHDTYYVYDDYGNQTFVIPPEVQTYASVWQQGDYKYVSLNDYKELFTTYMNVGGRGGAAYLSSWNKSFSLYYYTYSHGNLTPKNGSHFDLSSMGVDLPAGRLSGRVSYTTADGERKRGTISGYLMGNRVSVSGLPEEPVKHIYFQLSRHIGELRNDKPISQFQDQLESMMYQYRYDHRNRLVEKKIPGKDWEYIAYDALDRPVLTADGNLRAKHQALKTEYDAFGRVTQTGLVTGVSGSSHSAFKASITKPITTLYTQNYYDRYTFDKQGLRLPNSAVTGTQTQGLQTGSKVRVLGTSTTSTGSVSSGSAGKSGTEPVEVTEVYITTLLGYDKKGRLIYSGTHNPATDVVTQQTHTLDFVGRTTQTTTVETKNGNTLTKVDDYAYDYAGRLIDHDLTLNGQKEDLVQNSYDELGQLAQKTVGGGLQTVDYDYNVRGWLRHINDPDALGDDLFGFELDYGSLYNGNIQRTYWNTANDNIKRRYTYNYDGLNRLTGANYYAPGSNWGAYRSNYSYDRNGNIKRLYRSNGERIGIDYLTYTYNGNQLQAVTDAYRHSEGFNDRNTYGFDYLYDTNGNLTQDKNKGIDIMYNHLNLPETVKKDDQTLGYTYDATGVKHKKVFGTTNTTYTPNAVYKNNNLEMVFTPEGYAVPKSAEWTVISANLKHTITSTHSTHSTSSGSSGSSGKSDTEPVEVTDFTFTYQYKDHLGNNRLSYTDSNKDGTPEIVSETNYYPFGLQHKGYNEHVSSTNKGEDYKFNGVELNNDMDLGLYEMDFRQYDPTIIRFTGIDALSEQATNFSPYRFGFNNPIFYTDPTGLWEETAGGYSTSDKDEIQRLFGYLKNETSDISHKGITNFVKEDISFFEGSGGYNEGYQLSGLTVKGGEATPYSIHKTKNEIAYYTRATDYLYTKEDYEMRNIILSGGSDPISRELRRREYNGWYQPITAKNWGSYIGYKDSAQMLSFVSFFQLIDGPSLKVKGGSTTSRNNLAANSSSALGKRLGFSSGVIPNDVKNMTFRQFHQRFSGQYKGKFKGRGTYMTFMSMDFKMIKNAK